MGSHAEAVNKALNDCLKNTLEALTSLTLGPGQRRIELSRSCVTCQGDSVLGYVVHKCASPLALILHGAT